MPTTPGFDKLPQPSQTQTLPPGATWAPSVNPDGPKSLREYLSQNFDDVDPNLDIAVPKSAGPWMVCVDWYSGPDAPAKARAMVMELRDNPDYKLNAFVFTKGAEERRAELKKAAEYVKTHAKRVADIMTCEVVGVGEFATLGEIADVIETRRIKRVPVVHGGKLVGIVSRADLLRLLASGGVTAPDDESDRSIRCRLFAELSDQKWSRLNESDIVVSDGVVHFWGVVGSEEERRALRVAAENTPGVRGVEDHTILGPLRPGPLFPVI